MRTILLTLFVWELVYRGLAVRRSGEDGCLSPITYTRDTLLSLRTRDILTTVDFSEARNSQLLQSKRLRKRGKRGGVRQRIRRRGNRPPLPSVVFGNVRSLRGKMEELRINNRVCFEYRESSLMVFTETWLHQNIPDSLVEFEGRSLVRLDRTEAAGKSRGGGIGIYIRDDWCKQYTVREAVCNPDLELLCLSLRPVYLPREFGNIVMCAVYVPPDGNAARAAARITDCVQQQLHKTPGAAVFILGDFNHCKLEQVLTGFEQYVQCVTRDQNILDKCYGNIFLKSIHCWTKASIGKLRRNNPRHSSHFRTYKMSFFLSW